jgi:hypothetical protein
MNLSIPGFSHKKFFETCSLNTLMKTVVVKGFPSTNPVKKNFIIIWRNLFERGKAFESVLFWYLDCFRACLPAKSFFKRQILKQQKSREKKTRPRTFFFFNT